MIISSIKNHNSSPLFHYPMNITKRENIEGNHLLHPIRINKQTLEGFMYTDYNTSDI